MKVLFIGGTGNLSSACAARLRSQGHEVWLLTRGKTPPPAGFHSVRADRHDVAGFQAALEAAAPEVVCDFIAFEPADLEPVFASLRGRIRQYVFVSSATVYRKPPPALPITEDTPLGNPFWDYAQKKEACEAWLRERTKQDAFPVTIVRPSHTYSCRWIPNPISSAGYAIARRMEEGLPVFVPGDGENPWTLTHADDFAVGFCGLIGQEAAIGQAVHITSDEVMTWNQIYAEIAAAVGVQAPQVLKIPTEFICRVAPEMTGPLLGDKAQPAVFDNSRIRRLVPAFVCRKSFREGVRESVQWLRAHPECQPNPKMDAVCDRVCSAWLEQGSAAAS